MSAPLWLNRKDLGISLGKGLPFVTERRATFKQALIFCGYYRQMGIAELLLSAQPERLFENLSKSARAFAFYLEAAPHEHQATSRAEPFFDAVACVDVPAARSIAKGSRATWNPDEEYEEDFLYMRLLMDGFVLDAERAHLDQLLARFEQVLVGGDPDVRLELCRALVQGDQKLFDESLERMLGEHRRKIERKLGAGHASPNAAATVHHLWVELLALLRFAQQSKLKVARNYPFAPSTARRTEPLPTPAPDAWRDIPSYLELE
ncbi:Imm49 family immunity protein [Corallococcus terminator]